MSTVDIVMATRDGAAFLADQLDSILAQSYTDWRLIVRDDGSTDSSPEIIESYRALHPDRVVVVRDDDGTLGFVRNFARALLQSTSAYTAFCDQDDVWLPDKLANSVEALRRLEGEVGADTPALIFSDLRVVDETLQPITDSLWAMADLDPSHATELVHMLSRNVVSGCTMMFNRPLRELAVPIPVEAAAHDWWIGAICSCLGASNFLRSPTVLYRQHDANVLGLTRTAMGSVRLAWNVLRHRMNYRVALAKRFTQATALADRFGPTMSADDRRVLETYLSLPHVGVMRRTVRARRAGLLPSGLIRSTIFVLTARVGRSVTAKRR